MNAAYPDTCDSIDALDADGAPHADLHCGDVLHLDCGDVRAIAEPGGIVIRGAGGAVWLTQAGLGDDVILRAGDAFQPRGRGKIVLQALRDSAVSITAAAARHPASADNVADTR